MPARNRALTRQRILDAVGDQLRLEGFRGVGINAIARRAGADKVLIYRYFGGLPELLEAYAHESDLWWTVDELIRDDDEALQADGPGSYLGMLLERHLAALRARPLTQEVMAWELVESNELTRALALVRAARGHALTRRLREIYPQVTAERLEAVLGVFGGAITYLVLRTRHEHDAVAESGDRDADWRRLMRVLQPMLHSMEHSLDGQADA